MSREILRKLRELRLTGFADEYEKQIREDVNYANMGFNERLMLLVDAEFDSQCNNRIKRLLKNAKLPDSAASLNKIEYYPDRNLNRSYIESWATNDYIKLARNIILLGKTGSGKTWLASALATNAIMKDSFRVFYIRSTELFRTLEQANTSGSRNKFIEKLIRVPLLIIDEFLMQDINKNQQAALLDIFEYRVGSSATILCSQYPIDAWHERLGGDVIADSLLDRLTTSTYVMEIEGEVSMRKRHQFKL